MTFPFRRPAQSFAPPPPDTPYRRAQQEWDARMGSAVLSARAYLEVMEKGPGFSALLWDFLDGRSKINRFRDTKQVPAETALSRAMSKELAARGFKFVGPTIVYAFMQAVGMVNDHLVQCHRHSACAEINASR